MVTYIKSMLSELDKDRVITKFNEFMQLDALGEIGKSFSDIMDNLLKGYCWNILEIKKNFYSTEISSEISMGTLVQKVAR